MNMNTSFNGANYGAYQVYGNNGGWRDVRDRDKLVADNLDGHGYSILDIGCNVGVSLINAIRNKKGDPNNCLGIDVDHGFVYEAEKLSKTILGPECPKYIVHNISKSLPERLIGMSFELIFLFSVWDYFSVSSDVLGIDGDEHTAISNIKYFCPKYIFLEGHADGEARMYNNIRENGKEYESWESIINNKLQAKSSMFLGMTDNNRRPLYKLCMK